MAPSPGAGAAGAPLAEEGVAPIPPPKSAADPAPPTGEEAPPTEGPLPAAPPPPPVAPPPPALYIISPAVARLSARLPVNADRPTLVHSLIAALPVLDGRTAVARVPPPATVADLEAFHTPAYLALLQADGAAETAAAATAAGLEDDCPPFPGLWDYVTHLAGGTLAAARALDAGAAHVAIALDGGRHHARAGAAAGFCYVNDAVLACRVLAAGGRRRVLYLDVDAHHGDGVEAAFLSDPAVLTISIHHAAPGFYPGTGAAAGASGRGAGAGFALNLPLARGARDGMFLTAATSLGAGAVRLFTPDALVLQLGADGLARDPVAGAWSLTPAVYGRLTAAVRGWCQRQGGGGGGGAPTPLLVLGGGGYESTETAKAWACGVCGAVGAAPPADVPDHDHAPLYGPTWRLGSCAVAPTVRDENEAGEVARGVEACLAGLRAGVERESGGKPHPRV